MKVKELIEELRILNPEKIVYGSRETEDIVRNTYKIDRVSVISGEIILILNDMPPL